MQYNMQKVIVSMTTIPSRKKRLVENLPSLINQSYMFNNLLINIDDNLSEEDYEFYESLKKYDERIIINKADAKWRSCNKLLPTLKMYPEDLIITVDDDTYYPKDCIKYLVEEKTLHPDCIIAHEVNPIFVDVEKKYVTFFNTIDIKLMQKEWGKYLSNCCLFPPHVFDNTDLYDYEKMMYCTNGTHDELWFWVQSTLNNVMVIGLNYIKSFHSEIITPWQEDEYRLTDINCNDEAVDAYMTKINQMYGEQLVNNITSKPVIFTINKDNIYAFILLIDRIKRIHNTEIRVAFDVDLTDMWKKEVISVIHNNK